MDRSFHECNEVVGLRSEPTRGDDRRLERHIHTQEACFIFLFESEASIFGGAIQTLDLMHSTANLAMNVSNNTAFGQEATADGEIL